MSAVWTKNEYGPKWIPVCELAVVWTDAQRGVSRKKVEEIKEHFDPDVLGVLTVAWSDEDNCYHIIDGQHRATAVRELWGDNERVPCTVLSGRDKKNAAHIWSEMNGRRAMPQAVERFLVGVTARYEDEVQVNGIVKRAGYRVSMGSEDGCIAAVQALLAVYRKYGTVTLLRTLTTIRETWGAARDGTVAAIIRGVAEFLAEHPTADMDRLVKKTSKQYTPGRLMGAAKTAREMFGGTLHVNVHKLLVQCYNNGLRNSSRIEDAA